MGLTGSKGQGFVQTVQRTGDSPALLLETGVLLLRLFSSSPLDHSRIVGLGICPRRRTAFSRRKSLMCNCWESIRRSSSVQQVESAENAR